MDSILEPLLLVHRVLGYAAVFLIGPLALLTWRSAPTHRRWGKLYVAVMLLLYVTGTPRTLLFQPWPSWGLLRNVAFNLFGILQVFVGYRAIRQWAAGRATSIVDRFETALVVALGIVMLVVGLSDVPVFLIGLFALGLAVIDVRERRTAPADKQTHLRRHVRHMFGSYYYLLTVLSIVHLPAEHGWKWLWSGGFGLGLWIVARLAGWKWRLPRGRVVAWSVRGALLANGALCALVLVQAGRFVWAAYFTAPISYEDKLAHRWRQFETAQRYLVDAERSSRRIERTEWESLLRPAVEFRLTADEERRLRDDQRQRIAQRAVAARRASTFDLDALRHGPKLSKFCRRLPKGGMLHVHPTGTLHPETVERLLDRINPCVHDERLPHAAAFLPGEVGFLERYGTSARFHDLTREDRRRFCALYTMPQSTADFDRFDAVFALVGFLHADPAVDSWAMICDDFFARARAHHVRYVEFTMSFSPEETRLQQLEAIGRRAETEFGIALRINYALNRAVPHSLNRRRLQAVTALLEQRPSSVVIGIDLLGNERKHPALEAGQGLFTAASADAPVPTFKQTIHVVGVGQSQNVRDAMLLGAERIGHGTQWPDDPTILEFAARRRLPIEANLVSNVRLGHVRDFASHPFLDLLRLGLRVSLSTDDEGIFLTDISNEFFHAISQTDITYAEVKQLVYHSLETAFVNDDERRKLLVGLDADFQQFEEYDLPKLFGTSALNVAERDTGQLR